MNRNLLPIILSRTHRSSSVQIDCDCDCNCDCDLSYESSSVTNAFPVTLNNREQLVLADGLYCAPLEGDYYFAFNPFAINGQVVVLNSCVMEIIHCFRSCRSIADVIEELGRKGFDQEITKHAITELNHFSVLVSEEWNPGEISETIDVLVAWLHVTNACNLRCSYCYLTKTDEAMRIDVGKKAIDAIFRSAHKNRFSAVKLKFAGGEATLNFNLITKLYDYASRIASEMAIDLRGVILSNGIGITQKMIDAIMKHNLKLVVSLDGLEQANDKQRMFVNGEGSFKVVSRTIDRLIAQGLMPSISITVTDNNIDGLGDLIRYVLGHKLAFSLNFFRDNSCTVPSQNLVYSNEHMINGIKSAYRVIEEMHPNYNVLTSITDRANFARPHHTPCGVGQNYVVIDERGNVAKCQMVIKNIVGTIEAPDIVTLIRENRSRATNPLAQDKQECKYCQWRNWCGGGCPLVTYKATGRYDVKSPNCDIYRAIFPDALRLEGLRILRENFAYDTIGIPSTIMNLSSMVY